MHVRNMAIFIIETRPNLCSFGHPEHLCFLNLVEALQQCFDGKNVPFFPVLLTFEMRLIVIVELIVGAWFLFFAEHEFIDFVYLESSKRRCGPEMVLRCGEWSKSNDFDLGDF